MFVKISKMIIGKFTQSNFKFFNGIKIIRIENRVGFDDVIQSGIPHEHHHILSGFARSLGRPFLFNPCGEYESIGHHAQVLIPRRVHLKVSMKGDVLKSYLGDDLTQGLLGVKPFSIELVDDDTLVGIGDHLPGDQPFFIGSQRPFPTYEMFFVYPLPASWNKVFF